MVAVTLGLKVSSVEVSVCSWIGTGPASVIAALAAGSSTSPSIWPTGFRLSIAIPEALLSCVRKLFPTCVAIAWQWSGVKNMSNRFTSCSSMNGIS